MGGLNLSSRKKFIKQLFAGGLSLGFFSIFPPRLFGASKKKATTITILHTNDVHSHIEPFPENDPKYPGLGGAARRAFLIQKIRNEEKNVLLFDAGDIFQGTPYFNKYHGEIDFKLMSLMQYDAATIGNHDFDNGIDGLNAMLPHANFSFVNANYNFVNTSLQGKIRQYKIFMRSGVKIGVFGLGVELKGLVDKKLYGNTRYNDPIAVAKRMAELLKNKEKCDLVICLSHLGYQYKSDKVSDIKLAKSTENIDLIIGGHTHTFLEKPTKIRNLSGKITFITQVGWAGINLGRIDFNLRNNNYSVSSQNIRIRNKKN